MIGHRAIAALALLAFLHLPALAFAERKVVVAKPVSLLDRAKDAVRDRTTQKWLRKIAISKPTLAFLEHRHPNGFDAVAGLGTRVIAALLPKIQTLESKVIAAGLSNVWGEHVAAVRGYLKQHGLKKLRELLLSLGRLDERYPKIDPAATRQLPLFLDYASELFRVLSLEQIATLGAAVHKHRMGSGLFVMANGRGALVELAKSSPPDEIARRLASYEALPFKDARAAKRIIVSQQPRDRRGRFVKVHSEAHQAAIFEKSDGKAPQARLFRGETKDGRLPFEVFENGIQPHDPTAPADWVSHLISSRGSSYISTTTRPHIAWIYSGRHGIIYAIDPHKVAGESVDGLLKAHATDFTVGSHKERDARGETVEIPVLVGKKGETLLNQGTGEWIHKGGIPAGAVVSATVYSNGRVIAVLENPRYTP